MRHDRHSSTPTTLIASSVLGLALALGSLGCGGEDDDSGPSNASLCEDSCVAALGAQCSAEVGQPPEVCHQQCLAYFEAYPNCEQELRTVTACPALLEPSGWECDAAGTSVSKTTVCVAEQQAINVCAAGATN